MQNPRSRGGDSSSHWARDGIDTFLWDPYRNNWDSPVILGDDGGVRPPR